MLILLFRTGHYSVVDHEHDRKYKTKSKYNSDGEEGQNNRKAKFVVHERLYVQSTHGRGIIFVLLVLILFYFLSSLIIVFSNLTFILLNTEVYLLCSS